MIPVSIHIRKISTQENTSEIEQLTVIKTKQNLWSNSGVGWREEVNDAQSWVCFVADWLSLGKERIKGCSSEEGGRANMFLTHVII